MIKKYKNLYANGDSFVFGMESIEDCSQVEENKNYAFPKFLADLLGCDVYENNSYCGSPNDFIFRRTVFDLLNQKLAPEDTFVVIGWTSLHRIEVDSQGYLDQLPEFLLSKDGPLGHSAPREHRDHSVVFVNPGWYIKFSKDNKEINQGKEIVNWCTKYIWKENLQIPQLEAKIVALHHMLNSLGYDHIFVNTVENLPRTSILDTSCKNFYKLDTDSFFQWAIQNMPEHHRPWNHFSSAAHEKYAHLLYNFMIEKYV